MIKYKAWFGEIKAIEVKSETDKMVVFLNGRKEKKESSYYGWFDSWSDAHLYLVGKCEKEVESIHRQLDVKKEELLKIKSLLPN